MTTLTGTELFEYLGNLETELGKRISTSQEGGLPYLMHSQMREIIVAERDFLKYINQNGTQALLSISPNGLPSVASLNPDLEKICELGNEEKSFSDIGKQYKKGIDGKNKGENQKLYVPASEEEYKKELANYKPEQLLLQRGFAIEETEDGKLELALREDIHLKGYDEHSKEFPVLIREGKMRYHVVWNRLIDDFEESFYVPNTALVLQERQVKTITRVFNTIWISYDLKKSDFKGFKKPFFQSWDSIDYASFLAAGTSRRVEITENYLEIISKAFGKQVILEGLARKSDLEQTLAFSNVPFKNAPKTVLTELNLYENNGQPLDLYHNGNIKEGVSPYKKLGSKFRTNFNLVFKTSKDKIGAIEYVLPHRAIYTVSDSCMWKSYYKFTRGSIDLKVFGSFILNEDQYSAIRDGVLLL